MPTLMKSMNRVIACSYSFDHLIRFLVGMTPPRAGCTEIMPLFGELELRRHDNRH